MGPPTSRTGKSAPPGPPPRQGALSAARRSSVPTEVDSPEPADPDGMPQKPAWVWAHLGWTYAHGSFSGLGWSVGRARRTVFTFHRPSRREAPRRSPPTTGRCILQSCAACPTQDTRNRPRTQDRGRSCSPRHNRVGRTGWLRVWVGASIARRLRKSRRSRTATMAAIRVDRGS
jgi:hypothetical protein